MRKSFRLTLACSAILFASQLSGMNNQDNPNNLNSNHQGQPQQNVNANNNPQNQGNGNPQDVFEEMLNELLRSLEQNRLSMQMRPDTGVTHDYPGQTYQQPMQMRPDTGVTHYLQSSYQPLPRQYLMSNTEVTHDYPQQTHQQPMQMQSDAYDYGYPQQPPVHHQPAPSTQLTDAQAFQLWPRDLRSILHSSHLSPQELSQAEANINSWIRNVSADRVFVSGDPSKNRPNDFVEEVRSLLPRKGYADRQASLITPANLTTMFDNVYSLYRQFFIRILWDLDSPEVREWKAQWEARPGREDEKRKFNEDLANFIALTPYRIVTSTNNPRTAMNLLGQCRQSLEDGFRLLRQVVDIMSELGLLVQQPSGYNYQLPGGFSIRIPASMFDIPSNSPIFQAPLNSISDAIRASYSTSEQNIALCGLNSMVNEASENRLFISGNSSKNKLSDLIAEVDYLERNGQEGFGAVVASLAGGVPGHSSFDIVKAQNTLFFIRMLWILESPEARGWINQWNQHIQAQNMQDEQQRMNIFNTDLQNFASQIPNSFVTRPKNSQQETEFLNQSQQLRQIGFSLMNRLIQIVRSLETENLI